MRDVEGVRQQYERFPYPPVPLLALPTRNQGEGLRYEMGAALAQAAGMERVAPRHRGLRILVAGAGTLEPLVVAQMHPLAAEIVAVDVSDASLKRLAGRLRWARWRDRLFLAALRGGKLPPIKLVQADLHNWRGGGFDYILASNLLQHNPDPAALFRHLASMLKPGGLMRVVTYPAQSRFWIRQTRAWLAWHGLTLQTPRLKRQARAAIGTLPFGHPIRSCFEGHGEHGSATGLVDAFFHALENPLPPLVWGREVAASGLCLLGEMQTPTSRSDFLLELLPRATPLNPWQRLQVLDDLLELAASPVWWLGRDDAAHDLSAYAFPPPTSAAEGSDMCLSTSLSVEEVAARVFEETESPEWQLPSLPYFEMGQGLRRAAQMLERIGVDEAQLVEALINETAPRVDRHQRDLPGLTLAEHAPHTLMYCPEPWGEPQWQALKAALGPQWCLKLNGECVPGTGLAEQADWLQLRVGAQQALIGPLSLTRLD